jgi:hypothetical protein
MRPVALQFAAAMPPGPLFAEIRALRSKPEIGLTFPAGLIAIKCPGMPGSDRQT